MKKVLLLNILIYITLFGISRAFAQVPASSNYKLYNYGFGSGSTASSSSTNYSLFGTAGQIDQGSPSSSLYTLGAGLEYTLMASQPAAPTVTNPNGNSYNKLRITINRGGADPTDYKYAIAIASGSGEFQYIQNDNTIGSALGTEDWQSYSTWGGSGGFLAISLSPGTTYTVKVSAKQGDFFTQSPWGPTAQAATVNPTFTFSLQTTSQPSPPFTVSIGTIVAGSVATSTDKITATVSTNGASGAVVYLTGANTGIKSTNASNYTISSSSNDLSLISEGYGARGTTITQTSGGPMELVSPYAGFGNNVGIIDTTKRTFADSTGAPVTNGQASFELQAKASNTTPSATDYSDTLTVIGTGVF